MKRLNIKLLIPTAVVVATVLIFFFWRSNDIQVSPIQIDNKTSIQFPYTDDTSGESLIIKTNQKTYSGLSNSEVYISITNTRNIDEKAVLLFHMPKPPDGAKAGEAPSVTTLEQYEPTKQKDNQGPPSVDRGRSLVGGWSFIKFFKGDIKINPKLLSVAIKKRASIPQTMAINAGTEIEIPANKTIYFKSHIKYPPGSNGEFWIETIGTQGGYGLLDPWYASTHKYRKLITIPAAKVSGGANLSNFPVLISHTDIDIATIANGGKAASGSGEFIFTSSDGTTSLPYEIETYSATTGQFIGWVNVTTLSATADTYIYMYYGGAASGATNQQKTATWNTAYQGVWHFPNGTTLTAGDSTSNANNGTINGTITATAGQIDGAATATWSASNYISVADSSSVEFNTGNVITISGWIKLNNITGFQTIAAKGRTSLGISQKSNYAIRNNGGQAEFYYRNSGDTQFNVWQTTSSILTASTSTYVTVTYTFATGSSIVMYVNGSSQGGSWITNAGNDAPYVDTAQLWFGTINNTGALAEALTGPLDEVRISNSARSAGWIATEYTNQSSPRTFYGLGGQQAANRTAAGTQFGTTVSADTKPGWYQSGANNWSNRKKITIPFTKVSGGANLTNFPVLISHTDPDLRTTANGGKAASGSGEFIFTASDGTTSLPYEIETYSSSSGQFIGWVNVTTLSATADTYLYMYYGGAAAGAATNQNKTGTWNAAYQGVWHLPNGMATSTPTYVQSAYNRAASGQVSKAFTSNNTASNLIIAAISCETNTATSNTPTDTRSNTYTKATSISFAQGEVEIWYAKNITAGANTVSATCSSGLIHLLIHEYSGLDTAAPLDQISSSVTENSGITPAVTTTVANELLFGFMGSNLNPSVGGSYTQRIKDAFNIYVISEDMTVSATGNYSTNFTNVQTNGRLFASFKAGTASTLSGADSTSNANNGTKVGDVAATTGQVDGGSIYDGSGDKITLGSTNTPVTITLSTWVKTSATVQQPMFSNRSAGDLYYGMGSNGTFFIYNGTSANSIGTINNNVWRYVVWTNGGSTSNFYIDGSFNASTSQTTTSYTNTGSIGWDQSNNEWFAGSIDEMRLSNIVRSAGWIATEYANQFSPRTFYGLGNQEGRTSANPNLKYGTTASADTKSNWYVSGANTWKNRIKITVPSKVVSGGANLSNFPMLLSFTEPDIATTANGGRAASGSGEFVVTSSDGTTVLPYEVESYSATTGNFIGWVNVTTLSVSADTVMYMYYNGPAAGAATNQNKTGTWNTAYKQVYHLSNGTTLTARDSTSNANNGTLVGPPTATTGKIDGGANFSPTQGITATAFTSTSFTIESWYNSNSGSDQFLEVGGELNGNQNHYLWYNAGRWDFGFHGGGIFIDYFYTVSINGTGWHHIAHTYDGANEILYIDGSQVSSNPETHTPDTSASTFYFGENQSSGSGWSGKLDEFRISNSVRSAGWIATEYQNQISPRTFYSIGRPESMTVGGNSGGETPGGIKIK